MHIFKIHMLEKYCNFITKTEAICLKNINFQNLIKVSIDKDRKTLQNPRNVFISFCNKRNHDD